MGKVASHNDQLGSIFQTIDGSDCVLEGFGAQRIGRPVEADVRVAQLSEGKWRRGFAVEIGERAEEPFRARAARQRREYAVERADAESGPVTRRNDRRSRFPPVHLR
jgi:hypothetical protein